MRGQSGYSDEQKAQALQVFDEQGIWAAVTASGVHHTTIYRWHADRVRSLETNPEREKAEEAHAGAMRRHLRGRMMQVALAHVDRSDAAKNGREAQAYATAAAILHDKFRLEMGEATDRTEHVASPSKQVEAKLDELAERREKREAV